MNTQWAGATPWQRHCHAHMHLHILFETSHYYQIYNES